MLIKVNTLLAGKTFTIIIWHKTIVGADILLHPKLQLPRCLYLHKFLIYYFSGWVVVVVVVGLIEIKANSVQLQLQ